MKLKIISYKLKITNIVKNSIKLIFKKHFKYIKKINLNIDLKIKNKKSIILKMIILTNKEKKFFFKIKSKNIHNLIEKTNIKINNINDKNMQTI